MRKIPTFVPRVLTTSDRSQSSIGGSVNQQVLDFFVKNYAPGRVGLIGSANPLYKIIREGQMSLTKDERPSKYNHAFIMGSQRDDGRNDGGIYIFESDLHVSVHDWELKNGIMESRLTKWCLDDLEYAAVLGLDLSKEESDAIVRNALWFGYDDEHLRYPVAELIGTLWAMGTGKMQQMNVFYHKHAIQCASFARLCYQSIGRDFIQSGTHPSHTTPEEISQSPLFTFRREWAI